MVIAADEYRWSSIHAYYGGMEYSAELTDPEFILEMIHEKRTEAIKRFKEFMQQENEDQCLDVQIKACKNDDEVKTEIEELMNDQPIGKLMGLGKEERKKILQANKKKRRYNTTANRPCNRNQSEHCI